VTFGAWQSAVLNTTSTIPCKSQNDFSKELEGNSHLPHDTPIQPVALAITCFLAKASAVIAPAA